MRGGYCRSYSNTSSGGCSAESQAMARHKERCFDQGEFYRDAAAGTLPAFSMITPPGEACDHPCHDIAKGERLHKDVYEALRAGPGWDNTLFFVAYDDGGGFYDHVVPPHEGVPNPGTDDVCMAGPGCSKHPFDFRRLGIRVSGFLISPWIPANTAIGDPSGPTPSSRYDLTSGIATAKEMFGLPSFLVRRAAPPPIPYVCACVCTTRTTGG
jgi:phospholipase C